jgi:hypothetical protein
MIAIRPVKEIAIEGGPTHTTQHNTQFDQQHDHQNFMVMKKNEKEGMSALMTSTLREDERKRGTRTTVFDCPSTFILLDSCHLQSQRGYLPLQKLKPSFDVSVQEP